jgi:trans-aconitate 2-methyltransferase
MLANEYKPSKTIMLEPLTMPQMLENAANPAEAQTEKSSSRRSRAAGSEDTEQDIAMTDWDGTEYRRVSDLQQSLAQRALDGLELDGVGSLLDVGCGDGRITAEIASRIPDADIVGLDPSPRMISIAPARGRLSFQLGDVCTMTYDGRFDAVVSFNALHWVMDQRLALSRIAAALRPSGFALLVFVCAGERPGLEDVAMQIVRRPSWQEYFHGFEAPFVHPEIGAWTQIAESCGLNEVDTTVDDLEWDFGSRERFQRWVSVGFGAWTDHLPVGVGEAFVSEVVDGYEKVTGSAGVFRFLQLRAQLSREGATP